MDALRNRVIDTLSHRWSVILIRGIVAIAFGILTWARPGISLVAIITLFGFFAILDGILAITAAMEPGADRSYRRLLILSGVVGMIVGLVTFVVPGLTAVAFLLYIAVWAILRGVFEIAIAIRVRREVEGEWRMIVAGALSVTFGLLLLARPGSGVLTLLWLVGAYAIAVGVLLVMLAFKARGLGHRLVHI